MFDSSQFPQIPFDEISKRINADSVVVTPNSRLALALNEKFNQDQIKQKKSAWYSADILPFSSLTERIYLESSYVKPIATLPLLLSVHQEQVLWESIILSSEVGKALLRIPQTARLVSEAWYLAHAWRLIHRLGDVVPNEDVREFLGWAETYQNITTQTRRTDQARICDLITEQYEFLDIKKPSLIICYGFDVITPQQIVFLKKLSDCGCEVVVANPTIQWPQSVATIQRCEYTNSQEEIYQAAIWARSKIETVSNSVNGVRVGIVVPALVKYRNTLIRIFKKVMHPDIRFALPGTTRNIAPFNVSLGLELISYPLIDIAFIGLALLNQKVEFNRISYWLRSPFLAGSESEMSQRVLLDAQIRRFSEPEISLERLFILVSRASGGKECPILLHCLSVLRIFGQTRLPESASHTVFARVIAEVLQILGFPGERGLDSSEFQALKKWQLLIANFAALDQVNVKTSYHEAVSRLRQMASDTLFQPETPNVPVQIIDVFDAIGMEFDHLWVMGLSDEQWPLKSHPNPFLPLELQRKAKLPWGSTLESYAYCQRLTRNWLCSAKDIILTYPRYSNDRDGHELKCSPLIRLMPLSGPVVRDMEQHHDRIIQSCEMEYIVDCESPPLDKEIVKQGIRGGTSIIKDYAACPFRAWAKHRLSISGLDAPHTGLNAAERGLLVHQVLAQLWQQLKTKEALDDISDYNLERMLKDITNSAILQMEQYRPIALSGRFAQIEQRRLFRLALEWLDEEKKRSSFKVIAVEEKCVIQIGDLILSTRLDRIDELENGQWIVIDYKTSRKSIQSMIGERPDEPQLPLYLMMEGMKQQAAGAAFAVLKRGEMGFTAIVREANLLPGIKAFSQLEKCARFNTWEDLIAAWQQYLTNLATGFCSGDARVNPKNFPATCKYCDMQLFCRIRERIDDSVTELSKESG
ncbi:PD-(D/E)XK nuclease family protein [Nitrosomonas ureae]|uniref:Probable DNA repair protein n=1 Tax=Nitrosomonas ureae TaxID=44577 RepID=A0A1H2GIP6_9PROT|nr:PD-(D/E)XK nuclease family protein [Nitrosomonas ureae]ALQ52183.1 DNA repair protein [Nitrosomonas ureae]SDU19268.1 probable DNA repair protein [Nitrosomonas ureae]